MKRSNSPSLMGTEAGRSMGSIGDALKSMGASAEAVVRVVETNVVSTKFLKEAEFEIQTQAFCALIEVSGGCQANLRGKRIVHVSSVCEVKGDSDGFYKRLSIQRLSGPMRLAIRGSLNAYRA